MSTRTEADPPKGLEANAANIDRHSQIVITPVQEPGQMPCLPSLQFAKAYYSIAEACAIAGIRRTTLYKAINAGALRATKIGRRTFITAPDLRHWLEGMPAVGVGRKPK